MKILSVTQNYHPSVGGTQYLVKRIAETLQQEYGDEVSVCTINSYFGPNRLIFKKIKKEQEIINNIPVRRFKFLRLQTPLVNYLRRVYGRVFKKDIPFFIHQYLYGPVSYPMFKAMANTDADIIFASSLEYLFGDYSMWRRWLQNPKPFVIHGSLHIHSGYTIPARLLKRLKLADYYLANTEFEKQFLVRNGVNSDSVIVTGVGVDMDLLIEDEQLISQAKKQYNVSGKELVITYFGRLEHAKGIQELLQAFERIEKDVPCLRLIIAGATGRFTEELLAYSKANNRVSVFADVSVEDKRKILNISDVFVLPSKEESFGIVFLEAWSCKKPVIGASIGAVRSVISEGIDGLLFEPGNAEDLSRKLLLLIKNKDLRDSMGRNGYEKTSANYTWPVITNKFRTAFVKSIEKFNSR